MRQEEIYQEIDDLSQELTAIEGVETVTAMSGGTTVSLTGGTSSGKKQTTFTLYALLDETHSNDASRVAKEITEAAKGKEDIYELEVSSSDMDMSALNEIGNIVSGSYLTAISKLTNLKMISTVPEMTIDMIGALLSVPASEFGKYGDKLLLIQSQFGELDFVNGYFLMIPELDSYDKLLASLGM